MVSSNEIGMEKFRWKDSLYKDSAIVNIDVTIGEHYLRTDRCALSAGDGWGRGGPAVARLARDHVKININSLQRSGDWEQPPSPAPEAESSSSASGR